MQRKGSIDPKFVLLQMPVLVDEPPEGDLWIYEVKYDGYRTQLHVNQWGGRAFTRNGHDWTRKYSNILHHTGAPSCRTAILDGEVAVLDAEGRSRFADVRSAVERKPDSLVFVAFDLLSLER